MSCVVNGNGRRSSDDESTASNHNDIKHGPHVPLDHPRGVITTLVMNLKPLIIIEITYEYGTMSVPPRDKAP